MKIIPSSQQRGFSLIEIIVALFIFTILALIAAGGLATASKMQNKLQIKFNTLAELQYAYAMMDTDIKQIVARSIIDNSGSFSPAVVINAGDVEGTGDSQEHATNRLEFTRAGHPSPFPALPLSHEQRVAYVEQGSNLLRYTWRALDRVSDSKPDHRVLLSDVSDINIQFVDARGHMVDNWSMHANQTTVATAAGNVEIFTGVNMDDLPRGIIITFTKKQVGRIEWVFKLATAINYARK